MEIREGGLSEPAVETMLRAHFEQMLTHSPEGSCHFLDLDGLRGRDVTLWSAWDGDTVLGCGALREIDPRHGEIKSMRTAPFMLRRGVGAAILKTILATARERGYVRLSLETGSGPAFEPAHQLYRLFGFSDCPAFADYADDDPFSRFMTRVL